uniref:Uncharacterized protein n=1 Tax=Avena sativa TaxID=4498 RepID=A0ACD6AJ99_AVESA
MFLMTVVATGLGTAFGASYTVGAPGGSWDLKTNYTRWASATTFYTGDKLWFQYSGVEHNVVEVSKADYDACNGSSPIATFKTGNDAVALAASGSRYFICSVPGHCSAGMKVQVNIRSKVVRCRGRGIRQRVSVCFGAARSGRHGGWYCALLLESTKGDVYILSLSSFFR